MQKNRIINSNFEVFCIKIKTPFKRSDYESWGKAYSDLYSKVTRSRFTKFLNFYFNKYDSTASLSKFISQKTLSCVGMPKHLKSLMVFTNTSI